MKHILLSLLLSALTLPCFSQEPPGEAAPAAEKKLAYEVHRKLDGDKAVERFKYLTLKRNVARGDVLTLNRLFNEKSEELDRMNQRLEKRYPVDLTKEYRFDLEEHSLYEITPGEKKGDPPAEKKIQTFENMDDQKVFVRLLTSKRLTQVANTALRLVSREKQMELQQLEARLLEEFGIDSNGNYVYHASTKSIYVVKGQKAVVDNPADETPIAPSEK